MKTRTSFLQKRSKKLLVCLGVSLLWAGVAEAEAPTRIAVVLNGRTITITSNGFLDDVYGGAIVQLGKQGFVVPFGPLRYVPGTAEIIPLSAADMRSYVEIKRGYLLVDGNEDCTGWRCDSDTVFAVRRGKLVELGTIVHDEPEDVETDAQRFQRATGTAIGDHFVDIDDQLEGDSNIGHADAPGVLIAVHERKGKLVYDLTVCWPLNSDAYASKKEWLRTFPSTDVVGTTAALMEEIVIDKYCKRTDELRHDLDEARLRLPKNRYDDIVSVLGKLKIGGSPD